MIRADTISFVVARTGLAFIVCLCACGPGPEEPISQASTIDISEIQLQTPAILEAITEANRLVEAAPQDPNAWFELGRRLQANGLYIEAIRIYDTSLELLPSLHQANYLKAVAQRQAGQPQAAVSTLKALSEAGGTDAVMERALAGWSLDLGDLGSAETAAQRTIELESNCRGGHALLARVYIETGRLSEACTLLEPFVQRAVRHRYLDFLYATALMKDGRRDEAMKIMPGTPPVPPSWPDPYLEALTDLAAGFPAALQETRDWLNAGKLELALPRAGELYQNNPGSPAAAILYALSLRDSGRFDDALGILMDELDHRPQHPELLYQAAAVMTMAAQSTGNQAQLPAALELSEAAVEVDPGSYQTHGVRGAVLLSMGRLDKALEAFQHCAEIDPLSPAQCPTKVGNVLIMLGRVDEGLAILVEAVEQQPLEVAPTITYAVQLKANGRQQELDALMLRLRDGGSAFSDLRAMVERALASGETIEMPKFTGGASD